MILVPAYGRDYKSKKAVEEDFKADKDFIIADIMSAYDGKPVNRSQLVAEGFKTVNIRYKKLRSVCAIRV